MAYGRSVSVEWPKRDGYRLIVDKVLEGGWGVNLEQVRRGLAWHYQQYQNEQDALDRARPRRKTGGAGGVAKTVRHLDGVRQTLGELEAMLMPNGFFRVHKGFLVNLARVRALKPRPSDEAYKIALTGTAEEIPVARQRLAPLREALGEATRR